MPNRNSGKLLLLLLLILLLGVIGYQWLNQNEEKLPDQIQWAGEWEVIYYYEHEQGLLYTGTINLEWQDSLSGFAAIFPPAGKRAEKIQLQSLHLSKDAKTLKGYLIHDQYKIRGGHLREIFEFNRNQDNKFEGAGQCVDFCAEGTDGKTIIWKGTRKNT